MSNASWDRLIDYCIKQSPAQLRDASGGLAHPYISPAQVDSPFYATVQWDWDAYFASVALEQISILQETPQAYLEHQLGTIKNFLAAQDSQGRIAPMLDVDHELWDPLAETDPLKGNIHKPVLAQHLLLLVRSGLAATEVAPLLDGVAKFLDFYDEHFIHEPTGLAYWHTDFAIGVDNDPAIFYRPNFSTGSVYLSSLLYKELGAFAELAELAGSPDQGATYRTRAGALKDAVLAHCWDERDQIFYNVDLNLREINSEHWLHAGAPRAWNSLPIRIGGWSCFMPVWAGMATPEQAKAVAAHITDEDTFLGAYGIRTLSKQEPMFNLAESNNPSNWLGPVWGISNYLTFRALVVSGFDDLAQQVGERCLNLLAEDLERNNTLHEYYDPDSGEPVMTPGFLNWNLLVVNMWAWLTNRAQEDGPRVVIES